MNYLFAMLGSLFLGAVMVPWKIVLKTMSAGQLFMTMGSIFFVVGFVQNQIEKKPAVYDTRTLLLAVVTCLIYATGLVFVNEAYERSPDSALPVIGAIIAAFLVPAVVTSYVYLHAMPSLREVACMLAITAGLVVLGIIH